MVSNVAEKSRLQKANSDVPQIEIVTPEVPQAQTAPKIEIDEISSMHEVKAEREKRRREEAVQYNWEKLFGALFKINHPAQSFVDVPVLSKQTERFIQRLSDAYSCHADDTRVVLHNKNHSDIVVEQKKIFFAPAESQADAEKDFNLESAIVMAGLAAQNPLMIEKGIRLRGSKAQISLLREAIELVNKNQPEGQKLYIADGTAGKPAPAHAFEQSAGSQLAPNAGLAAKGRRLTQVFSTLLPQTAVIKNLVSVAARTTEIIKPEPKTAGGGIIGRAIASIKPEPIAFNAGRRKAVMGAGAALAVGVLLQPEAADAAGLARGVPRERNFWASLFGADFNDSHERRKAAAGPRRRSAKKSKRQTRKARTARQRHQEAVRRHRAKEVKHETRAQRAESQRRKDELARQKREQKSQAHREKAKHHKKEKHAAQEKKNPGAKRDVRQEKQAENNSLRQQKREAQEQRNRSPVTGNEVILYNTHTGQSLRLNFNTCGDNSFCDKFNHFARDHHDPRGRCTDMAPKLQYYLRDIVTDLRRKGYKVDQVNVISGYRTVHTNVSVLKNPSGARSQHCFGRALDIQIKGVSPKAIHKSAEKVGCDGIGLYPSFVHIDNRGFTARWG